MSSRNEYGSIKNGKVTARIYMRGNEVDYAACYQVFNDGEAGDKYDLPMQVVVANNRLCVTHGAQTVAFAPIDWTQFVTEVASRGPIAGVGCIQWMAAEQEFRLRLDIDET